MLPKKQLNPLHHMLQYPQVDIVEQVRLMQMMNINICESPEGTVESFERFRDEKFNCTGRPSRILVVFFDFRTVYGMVVSGELVKLSKAVKANFARWTSLTLDIMECSIFFLIRDPGTQYWEAKSLVAIRTVHNATVSALKAPENLFQHTVNCHLTLAPLYFCETCFFTELRRYR